MKGAAALFPMNFPAVLLSYNINTGHRYHSLPHILNTNSRSGVLMKTYLWPVLIFLLLLFTFPADCAAGAKQGLLLWFNTMIPSVFPFIFITGLIRAGGGIHFFNRIFGPVISHLFGCSKGGSYAVIIGFLCGYPMGSKAVCDSLSAKVIGRNEAVYLLCFCNNPSPMFVINFVLGACLGRLDLTPMFFSVIFISTWLNARIWRLLLLKKTDRCPAADLASVSASSASVDGCLMSSLELIQKIGGYMIVFSILCQLLFKLPAPPIENTPEFLPACLSGFMEQTTGLAALCALNIRDVIKIIASAVFVCFGGIAAAAQTYGIISAHQLPLKYYLISKAGHGIMAGTLTAVWIFFTN